MIKKVSVRRFKRFEKEDFGLEPNGLTICAGPNSSGKSSLLHALAVWSFGVMILRQFKGPEALTKGFKGQGAGLSKDDFTPVNIPDLRHLWHNLKSQVPGEGYSMAITVVWDRDGTEKKLTISFSLVQDRLYAKPKESNLTAEDEPPRIVYLPPVAGVDAREEFATPAKRRALLGRGLAGSVLRNFLLDLEQANRNQRRQKQGDKTKLSARDLEDLRQTDPWERLNATMRDVFGLELQCAPFNADFHSVIKVVVVPKRWDGKRWQNLKNDPKRDLMVEGAGAQQWLTVFAFALAPETDVLLLDEPDAHLHSRLKVEMIDRLGEIAESEDGPQILIATHAPEILKRHQLDRIMDFGQKHPKYLVEDVQRAKLVSGLGDEYAPLIEKARGSRFILFVENESDARILETLAETLELEWPNSIAIHPTAEKHADRLKLYRHLLGAIDGLKALSIRDRDNADINTIDSDTLRDKGTNTNGCPEFRARTWRRREIENYALVPSALAKVCGEGSANTWWKERGWNWPNEREALVEDPLRDCDIKQPLGELLKENGIEQVEGFFAKLNEDEIHDDLKRIVKEICEP